MPKTKVYTNVEAHNKISLEELREGFLPEDARGVIDVKGRTFKIELESSASLNKVDFEACFGLVRDGMKEM